MDAKKARAILRRVGVGGMLEAVLYGGAIRDSSGVFVTYCTDNQTAPVLTKHPGESLMGRLINTVDLGRDSFIITDGWRDGQPTQPLHRRIKVYYDAVHSIYPLVRRQLSSRSRTPAPGDPHDTTGHS